MRYFCLRSCATNLPSLRLYSFGSAPFLQRLLVPKPGADRARERLYELDGNRVRRQGRCSAQAGSDAQARTGIALDAVVGRGRVEINSRVLCTRLHLASHFRRQMSCMSFMSGVSVSGVMRKGNVSVMCHVICHVCVIMFSGGTSASYANELSGWATVIATGSRQ